MHVVITGSTKGIGLGMAREFLKRGHDVVISSRGSGPVEKAVAGLRRKSSGQDEELRRGIVQDRFLNGLGRAGDEDLDGVLGAA